MFVGQPLDRRLGIIRERDLKLQLAEHLGHEPGGLLLGAEKQRLIAHNRMVGTAGVHHQVTDVIGRMRTNPAVGARIPLWLKITWTAWILVWAPLYWKQYGAQNF